MPDSFRIEALTAGHDRSRFASGSDPLDRYFHELVSQDVKRRVATCFVAADARTNEIAGFYTLAATGVALPSLSAAMSRKLPRYPVIPAALLGRLAVSRSHQGRGLGGVLVSDAVRRVARAELGVFALVADAKDDSAVRFYLHHGFTLLPGEMRRLGLPIRDALRRPVLERL